MIDKTSDKYKTANYHMTNKAHLFLNRMLKKMDQKVDEGYSMQPWKDHDEHFLYHRLEQEFNELVEAWGKSMVGKSADIQDELIDVANLCFFLFWAIEEGKK